MALRVLAESQRFLLGHIYEQAQAVDKIDGLTLQVGEHYGDPVVGVITPDEQWLITGGEGLQCYSTRDGKIHAFFRRGHAPLLNSPVTHWPVTEIGLGEANSIFVRIDPQSEFASTWHLDLGSLELSRMGGSKPFGF